MSSEKHSAVAPRIIEKAQAQGSTATTVAGALRFLRANLPPAIPGLAYLDHPTGFPPRAHRDQERKWDRATAWTHDERVTRRARDIVQKLLTQHPAQPFSKVCSACGKLTADIAERVSTLLARRIADPLAQVLADTWPYRCSNSRWAGGEHEVTVKIEQAPAATCESKRVWSSNGKWSGTNSEATLHITPRCYDTFGSNLIIGGLITLDAEAVGIREYRATWAEQGKGFALKVVEGWIIRGYHVAGGTLEAARRKAERARRERLATLQVKRMGMAGVDLTKVMVTRADSVRAGNCPAGTDSFINSHIDVLGGRSSVPADELLKVADDTYTRAAVLRAAIRALAEGCRLGEVLEQEGTGGVLPVAIAGVDAAMSMPA